MDEDRSDPGERVDYGHLKSDLSQLVVGLTREYTGRDPTQRHGTHIDGNVVVVVMADTLTKGERTLARDGKSERVLQVRQDFQRTMKEELTGGVQRLTGRRVVAFMSTHHIDPDMACEIFVLEPTTDSDHHAGHEG